MLAVIDGERAVRDLAAALGRPEFEVARTLFGLATAGIIVLEDPTRRAMEAIGGADLPILLGEVDQLLGAGDPDAARAGGRAGGRASPRSSRWRIWRYGRALLAAGHSCRGRGGALAGGAARPASAPGHRLFGLGAGGRRTVPGGGAGLGAVAAAGRQAAGGGCSAAAVDRVRQAALTLDLALRGSRD